MCARTLATAFTSITADFVFRLDRKRNRRGQPSGPATLSNPKQKDRESIRDRMFELSDGITRLGFMPGDRVLLPLDVDEPEAESTPVDRAVGKVRTFRAGAERGVERTGTRPHYTRP